MLDYLVKFGTTKLPLTFMDTASYRAVEVKYKKEWQDANYLNHAMLESKKIEGEIGLTNISFDKFKTLMTMYNSAIEIGDGGQENVTITVYVPKLATYKTISARFDDFVPVIKKFTDNQQTYEDLTLKFAEN